MRTLERLDVVRGWGGEVHIHASAQSFLHNQIRSFAGSLKLVGEGRWTETTSSRRWNRATANAAARSRRPTGSTSRASTMRQPMTMPNRSETAA